MKQTKKKHKASFSLCLFFSVSTFFRPGALPLFPASTGPSPGECCMYMCMLIVAGAGACLPSGGRSVTPNARAFFLVASLASPLAALRAPAAARPRPHPCIASMMTLCSVHRGGDAGRGALRAADAALGPSERPTPPLHARVF